MNFLYSNLSPNDFEILCQDLLSHIYSQRFERFKAGKDSGIDLRLLNHEDKIIVQVKHCLGSYGSNNKTMIKNELKVASVSFTNGERYILITSLGLSPHNKGEILMMAQGLIKAEDDIIGIDEIEDILTRCPEIVKRHYKLWISSTTVLMRLLNNGIYGKSEDYLAKISRKIKLFVTTIKFTESQNILANNNILLITGDPGVGKTMLAEMLSLAYVKNEYQFIYADDIKEADDVFDKEAKQIFLLDDFLGSNYLEFIEGKIESRILRFMDRIQMYKNKKMILNSRTTIFNNALLKGIHLQDKTWKDFDCILEVKSYTNIEKAQILYNHLAFRDLEDCYLEYVKKNQGYLNIVKHQNFNPRVIEFITSDDKVQSRKGEEYLTFVTDLLNNPSSIWESAYRNQINDEAKILVQAVFSLGGSTYESTLKATFEERLKIEVRNSGIQTSDSPYNNSLKMLLDGFIRREIIKAVPHKLTRISFINPSVSDFMADYLNRNDVVLKRMVSSIIYVEQMSKLIKAQVLRNFYDTAVFKEMLSNPDKFDSIQHSNKSVAVLAMIYENNILMEPVIIQSLLKKALINSIKSHELNALCHLLDEATDSLNIVEIKNIFPNGIVCFKYLLDGCSDLNDLKMVISRADRLGINAQRVIKGNKEIRIAIQNVVEIETDALLSRDYDLNNVFEAVQVKNRLTALKKEIRAELLQIGFRYKGSFWHFDNADPDEIAYKNIVASADTEDGYVTNTPDGGNDGSDFDIDAVFKS